MTIEIPKSMEIALNQKAGMTGLSPVNYVFQVLERDLKNVSAKESPVRPFKDSYGILAKYGPAPTDEEMEENRKDMSSHGTSSLQ